MKTFTVLLLVLISFSWSAQAQVGKGLLDPNVASEAELTALPHMTPAIVKELMAGRPFMGALDLHTFFSDTAYPPHRPPNSMERRSFT